MNSISVQNDYLVITPNCEKNIEHIIMEIFALCKNAYVKKVSVDLSDFNIFKAIKLATLVSAKGIIKNPSITYEFVVANEFVKYQIKHMGLSNLTVISA